MRLAEYGGASCETGAEVSRNRPARLLRPEVDAESLPDWSERRSSTRRAQLRSTVSLVIPTKNEARNLATVLEHVPDCVNEVLVVDTESSDVTQMMARACNPAVRIVNQPTRGKGNALRAGFAAAEGDIIVAMDADGSMSPQEIPNLLYFLEHGFDFVKGSRFITGGASLDITPLRKAGNSALVTVANHLYGSRLTDLCYGFFGFRRHFLGHLDLQSEGFEIETEITVRAVLVGLRIAEVPSLELPRHSGSSNLRTFHDGARVLQTLFREHAKAKGQSHGRPSPFHSALTTEDEAQGVAL